uniref:CAMPATH-1 antigen n=1 Tax=Equus caballus TaxID=9796 RepID=A0A9L0S3L2_HORSE
MESSSVPPRGVESEAGIKFMKLLEASGPECYASPSWTMNSSREGTLTHSSFLTHTCLRLPCLVVQKQSSQKEPADSPAFISKSCCQESHQDPPKMKGFLFLLFTISLLVMIQIQTGVLGNKTKTMTTTKRPTKGAAPALGSLGGSCVLLFFTNALIRLFHLS